MSLDWATLTDGELATLSIAGRPTAFTEIMNRYRQPIFRLVRTFVGDEEEALDLTQECFISAHQALARFDPKRPMRTWLATIAINKCRDWGRKRTVRRILTLGGTLGAEAECVADDRVAVDDAASDRQELARVEKAIAALPSDLRETLILRTIEDLSQSETAKILGISEKAVETRLYRARAKLETATR
jgi:RNA polymerase sigma factor (sigma-70 family)